MRRLVALLTVLLVAGALRQAAPTHAVLPTRITFNGQSAFLAGANLPWFNYGCDFGCGDTGTPATSGVSNATVAAGVSAALAQAKADGLHTVRWWMFEGNAAAADIITNGTGVPVQITTKTYQDIDAAIALADQYDIYYDFVFFQSPTAIDSNSQNWISGSSQAAGLAATLGQLAAHYAGNPRIFSWEIYNEPEADIWNNRITQTPVYNSVKAITAALHANSSTYVTVGSLFLDGPAIWIGAGLDYYEVHWYDYMNTGNYDAYIQSYATIAAREGLDKPLVIGEFPATAAGFGDGITNAQRWAHWYGSGFAGAWAWSLIPSHTGDGYDIESTAVTAFTASHPGDMGPLTPAPDQNCQAQQTAADIHTALAVLPPNAALLRARTLLHIWMACEGVRGAST